MKNQITFRGKKKQKGVTLITALIFLTLMTIVGVSASRSSVIDTLVAANDQHQVEVYMSSAAILRKKVSAYSVISNLPKDTQTPSHLEEDAINGVSVKTVISRPDVYSYNCSGVGDRANSLGPDITCVVFNVHVKGSRKGTGAKDELVQGVGKEYPNITDSSYLNY